MENGGNNISIGNSAFGYSALSQTTTGTNCTAIGSSALMNQSMGATAIGYQSLLGTLATGISSVDNFFISKSLSIGKNDFIVKYNPLDSKWMIYNQGSMTKATNLIMIKVSSESKLFEHDNKKIGCFIINANKLELIDNDDYNLL